MTEPEGIKVRVQNIYFTTFDSETKTPEVGFVISTTNMVSRCLILSCWLTTISNAASASSQFTGATTILSGIPYWIPPEAIANIHQDIVDETLRYHNASSGGYAPVSVIHTASHNLTENKLGLEFSRYLKHDDVWTADFSQCTYDAKDVTSGYGELTATSGFLARTGR